ncbi:hypothetical protein ACLOJK_009362 [Asimina triloba]
MAYDAIAGIRKLTCELEYVEIKVIRLSSADVTAKHRKTILGKRDSYEGIPSCLEPISTIPTAKLSSQRSAFSRSTLASKQPCTSSLHVSSSWQSYPPGPVFPPLNQLFSVIFGNDDPGTIFCFFLFKALVASDSVAAIILGDESESGLYPLTKRRAAGAIPIAANYRLVDIAVSNCINNNITKIYALTQFNSTSLNSHLSNSYSNIGLGKDGFVEVLPAYQSPEHQDWFQGSADAVRKYLWMLEKHPVMEFLILPSHHLHRMDFHKLVQAHRSSASDITVAVSSTASNQNPGFSSLKVDCRNRKCRYIKKSERKQPKATTVGGLENSKDKLCNVKKMGIFLVQRDLMTKLLTEYFPEANDLGTEVISGAISMGLKNELVYKLKLGMNQVQAYLYDGYWEDMGTIEAFYLANMESTQKTTSGFKSVLFSAKKSEDNHSKNRSSLDTFPLLFSFFDRESPIYTLPRYLPPTTITNSAIEDSVIADGCIFNQCKIKGSVIGMKTCIGDGTVVEDSVVMGSDLYQTDDVHRSLIDKNGMDVPIGIGKQSHIRKAIIDKNARIGRNVKIINSDGVQEGNREDHGYVISGGIVIVLRSAVIPDGSIL